MANDSFKHKAIECNSLGKIFMTILVFSLLGVLMGVATVMGLRVGPAIDNPLTPLLLGGLGVT